MTINCTALTRDIHWNHSTRLPRTNESNASQLRNTENIMIFNNKTLRDTKQYNFTSEKQFINLVSVDKRETFDTSYVSNSILTKMKTEYTQQIVAKYRSLVPLTQQIKKVNTYDSLNENKKSIYHASWPCKGTNCRKTRPFCRRSCSTPGRTGAAGSTAGQVTLAASRIHYVRTMFERSRVHNRRRCSPVDFLFFIPGSVESWALINTLYMVHAKQNKTRIVLYTDNIFYPDLRPDMGKMKECIKSIVNNI